LDKDLSFTAVFKAQDVMIFMNEVVGRAFSPDRKLRREDRELVA